MGIFPGTSQGTFSEYSVNISWECSTNIPRTYICPEDIEYKSNSDRNKTLSVEEYLNEIRPY